jgi:hypothetical protein
MIFVFGSNLAGRHGKGAALFAARHYGAEQGVGRGRTGRSYALPTKDANLRTLSIVEIQMNIRDFAHHAILQKHETFLLTPIGCGLAGYSRTIIGEIVREIGLPDNVVLTHTWITEGP